MRERELITSVLEKLGFIKSERILNPRDIVMIDYEKHFDGWRITEEDEINGLEMRVSFYPNIDMPMIVSVYYGLKTLGYGFDSTSSHDIGFTSAEISKFGIEVWLERVIKAHLERIRQEISDSESVDLKANREAQNIIKNGIPIPEFTR